MSINLKAPEIQELKPRITVFGCGGAGGNAVNNMIASGLQGCDFVVANTDAQALASSRASRRIQMGIAVTQGLGAGSQPEIGRAAAEEVIDEIRDHLAGAHMVFITGGMGGGTGTGAAPVVARAARDLGILTVGVVTKPFHFEGQRRLRIADAGIQELQTAVDTLIIIPNQNLFRIANERTTFADAFAMADQVLNSGVACITDLMVKEGLINLDFADVRAVMREMGKAMMGTGEATGERRAITAAEAAISNPLLDEVSMKGARGLLISITGGRDMTLYEVDEAATRIREEVDQEANIIMGATFDESLEGAIRVSVVATGIDQAVIARAGEISATERHIADVAEKLAAEARARGLDASRIAAARRIAPATVARVEPVAPVVQTRPTAPPLAATAVEPAELVATEPVAAQPAHQSAELNQDDLSALIETATYVEPAHLAAVVETAAVSTPTVQPVQADPVEQPVAGPAVAAFAPTAADRLAPRPTRMPRIEDLPIPAQRQVRARTAPEAASGDAKRMTLLQRLAAVGLGRREEPVAEAPPAPPRAIVAAPPQPTATHAEFARRAPNPAAAPRAATGTLDPHGRIAPAPRLPEDEQLEIPAFLRRQAN
jgi:cell division protein FtsZ